MIYTAYNWTLLDHVWAMLHRDDTLQHRPDGLAHGAGGLRLHVSDRREEDLQARRPC